MRFSYALTLVSLFSLLPVLAAPTEAEKRDGGAVILEAEGYQFVNSDKTVGAWGGQGDEQWSFDFNGDSYWYEQFHATMYPSPTDGNIATWSLAQPTATLGCEIQVAVAPTSTVTMTLNYQPPYVPTPVAGQAQMLCTQV